MKRRGGERSRSGRSSGEPWLRRKSRSGRRMIAVVRCFGVRSTSPRPPKTTRAPCMRLVTRAIDSGLDQLAVEAIGAIKSSGDWGWACFALMRDYLRDRGRSYFLPQATAASWERRALGAAHDDGWAAKPLAHLGLRRLMRGEWERALQLWNGASPPSEVDDLLTDIAVEVAQWGWHEWAMEIAEAVDARAARAEALAKISKYL